MTEAIEIHEDDNVTIELNVTTPDGSAKDLTGAAIACVATDLKTGAKVVPTGLVSDALNGLATVQIMPASLVPSRWSIQVRVTTAAGDSQIVFDETINVKMNY